MTNPSDSTHIEIDLSLQRSEFWLAVRERLPAPAIIGIFGPSGAGKTTLLRCLAGLDKAVGNLSLAGTALQSSQDKIFLPPQHRHIGLVSQHDSLLPHLNVEQNLRYAEKRCRPSTHRPIVPKENIIEILGIHKLLNRKTPALSGGEKRRVAIARALISQPDLLLLDEPLTGLHGSARQRIVSALATAQHEYRLCFIWVSHDIDELSRLADHMLFLQAGKVIDRGPTQAVLCNLNNPFGLEAGTVWSCSIVHHDNHLTHLDADGLKLRIPRLTNASVAYPKGSNIRLRLPANAVGLSLQPVNESSILNSLPVEIEEIGIEEESQHLIRLTSAAGPLLSRISSYSKQTLDLKPGQRVYAQIKGAALVRKAI